MFMYDGKQLQIVDCNKIASICDHQVVILCSTFEYTIIGANLQILELNQKTIWITGTIVSIGIHHV